MADPFADLKTDDSTILQEASGRFTCPKCKKSAKYFCYRCFDVLGIDRNQIPFVKLPVHLDVIKHERELDGKSTAVHARVIADKDVDLYTWRQDTPTYEGDAAKRTLLLFPTEDAKTFEDIPRDSFDRVVVIDGTWKQADRIVRETPALQRLPKVAIKSRKTQFWRYQQKGDEFLATIEAIYYFYRDYAEAYECSPYDGRYDNLMFYYRFFHSMIQDKYRQSDKKFTHRHKQDYIKYDIDDNTS